MNSYPVMSGLFHWKIKIPINTHQYFMESTSFLFLVAHLFHKGLVSMFGSSRCSKFSETSLVGAFVFPRTLARLTYRCGGAVHKGFISGMKAIWKYWLKGPYSKVNIWYYIMIYISYKPYKPYTKGRLRLIQSSNMNWFKTKRWSTEDWNPGTLQLMDAVLSLLAGVSGSFHP